MLRRLVNALLYFLSGFVPRKRRRVILGTWHGLKYADNPRYLLEYLIEAGRDLEFVWCFRDVIPEVPGGTRVRCVRRGSAVATWLALTSATWVVSHGFTDISKYNLSRGAWAVFLGHGVTIKNMRPRDRQVRSPVARWVRSLVRKGLSYDLFVASSEGHAAKLIDELESQGATSSSVVRTGQPRNDWILANNDPAAISSIRKRLAQDAGIPLDKRLVLYMPTFRDGRSSQFSFLLLDEREQRMLVPVLERANAVLVERLHPVDHSKVAREMVGRAASPLQDAKGVSARHDRICSMDSIAVDSQEALLAADVLITDYSGSYVDYLLLDRPIVHFAYDLDYYRDVDRGLYYELQEVAGGDVVQSFEAALASLERCLESPADGAERRKRARTFFLGDEAGESSERIAQLVFER